MTQTTRSRAAAAEVCRLGDCGPVAAEIRARLHRLGLLTDGRGDEFDPEVDRAVRQFQQERGIAVDGIVAVRAVRHRDRTPP